MNIINLKEFRETIDHQIYLGGEMDGREAISHFTDLCEYILKNDGKKSPYLLRPVRMLIMHLFDAQEYEGALSWASAYKDLVAEHLYSDNFTKLSADLLISMMLKNAKRTAEALELETKTLERLKTLIDIDYSRFERYKKDLLKRCPNDPTSQP